MMHFVFALADFLFRIAYGILALGCSLVVNVFVIILKVLPIVLRVTSSILSVVVWIVSRLLLGLMGFAGKATNALSWLLVLCVVYLFIDQNLELPFLPLPMPVRDFCRKTKCYLFGADEVVVASSAENYRMEMENQNNANDQEEAVSARRRARRTPSSSRSRPSPLQSPSRSPSYAAPSTGVPDSLPSTRRVVDVLGSEDENEEEDDVLVQARLAPSHTSLCTVCLDRERNVAVFPCGHTHLCLSCASTIRHASNKCPTCRDDIQDYRIIYL